MDDKRQLRSEIEDLLKSPEKPQRLEGLKRAAEVLDFGLLSQTMDLIHDEDEEISQAALSVSVYLAEHCVASKDRTIGRLPRLNAVLVIEKYHPQFIEETRSNLESSEPSQVITALRCIRHFVKDETAAAILERFLEHPSEKVRATACLQIGLTASGKSRNIILDFLKDGDARVRANTIELLEKLEDPQFLAVINKYRYDKNNRIRANAVKALYTLGERDLEEDFRSMLEHEMPLMRTSAVWAIGEISRTDPRYVKLLKKVKDDPDELLQDNLRKALQKIGPIRKAKFLVKKFGKPEPVDSEKSAKPRRKRFLFF